MGQGRSRCAGIVKVDVLGLGMLSAIRVHSFDQWIGRLGRPGGGNHLATVPREDQCVYEMICRADTVRYFKSNRGPDVHAAAACAAQNYYDLVIEVAIVAPAPSKARWCIPTCAAATKKRR